MFNNSNQPCDGQRHKDDLKEDIRRYRSYIQSDGPLDCKLTDSLTN